MAWTNLATRVANTDSNAAADINALMEDARLIKGGTAGTAPTKSLETLITEVAAIGSPATDSYSADTSTTQTLTYTSGNITYNPTSDHDVNLPTTSVAAGWTRKLVNRSSTKVLTVKASGGNVVCKIIPKAWVIFQARQATPTAETHWMQMDAGGGWADWGGTAGSNFGAGYGTVYALGADQIQAKRDGDRLLLRGRYQAGTVSGATGRVLLPHGLSLNTSLVEDGTTLLGIYNMVYNNTTSPIWSTANNSGIFYYKASDGATYINPTSSFVGGAYEASLVSGFVATGAHIIFRELSIPIETWQIG